LLLTKKENQGVDMACKILETEIQDLKIITPQVFADDRGYFFESYKFSEFDNIGFDAKIAQINQSFSHKNVVRGLHFQVGESAQAKLVRCLSGEIYDVAVDLRKSSPTFGKSFGIHLSSENKKMFYIPIGFANGFSTLSDSAEIIYNVFGGEYNSRAESGIRFDDQDLKIDWQVKNPIVTPKDLALPYLRDLKDFF
jgi:dTDP-4-dehydrorhamnose 3,5-epimerase